MDEPDKNSEEVISLRKLLPRSFRNKIKSVNGNFAIIRSNVKNLEECSQWINEYSKRSKSKWITRTTKPKPTRFLCRKVYVCHHSGYRKKELKSGKKTKNLDCKASIDIVVKMATRNTKRKDPYIQKGLAAVIKLKNNHTHSMDAIEVLSALPASAEVKKCFRGYFDNGLGVAEALHYHEFQLALLKKENILDNATINPKYRTVQYWYDQWRKLTGTPSSRKPKASATKNKSPKDKTDSVKKEDSSAPCNGTQVKKEDAPPLNIKNESYPIPQLHNNQFNEENGLLRDMEAGNNMQTHDNGPLIPKNNSISTNGAVVLTSSRQVANQTTQDANNIIQIVSSSVQVVSNGSQIINNGGQSINNGVHTTNNGDSGGWGAPESQSDGFDRLGLYLADCLRKIKDPTKRKQYEYKLLQAMVGMDNEGV